jgi:membrane peptidoglycan carboxypeptidase
LRVLGARRPASGDEGAGYEPTRPLPQRSRRFRWARRTAKVLAALILILAAALGLLFVLTPSAGQATALAAAQAREHHVAYPGPPVPQYFAEALVATEDHRFYADPGVDPLALVRVAASWITGHTDGGGSTIDQQLAKNLYTAGHSSFPQIVEQVALAVKLNQAYSRDEILRLYAEIAYYGHGYYGLQAASCGYFGRPAAELTVVQAAMLAGAVNAPTYDDPLVYPAQARARLVHVIDRMAAVGYLTRAQQDAALNAPLDLPAARGCQ